MTIHTQYSFREARWSSCNKFIAVINREMVEVRDPMTFRRLNAFELPAEQPLGQAVLSFSPYSRFLAHFVPGKLTSWDLRTGGPICGVPSPLTGLDVQLKRVFSPTYSLSGRMFATAHIIWGNSNSCISIYNLLSGMPTHSHRTHEGSIIDPGIWTHGEYFRFATAKSGSITIWEVGFTPAYALVEAEQLSIPYEIMARGTLYLPALSRLAFLSRDKTLVWDAKGSELLLRSPPIIDGSAVPPDPKKSFSSDGSFFASQAGHIEAYV